MQKYTAMAASQAQLLYFDRAEEKKTELMLLPMLNNGRTLSIQSPPLRLPAFLLYRPI